MLEQRAPSLGGPRISTNHVALFERASLDLVGFVQLEVRVDLLGLLDDALWARVSRRKSKGACCVDTHLGRAVQGYWLGALHDNTGPLHLRDGVGQGARPGLVSCDQLGRQNLHWSRVSRLRKEWHIRVHQPPPWPRRHTPEWP